RHDSGDWPASTQLFAASRYESDRTPTSSAQSCTSACMQGESDAQPAWSETALQNASAGDTGSFAAPPLESSLEQAPTVMAPIRIEKSKLACRFMALRRSGDVGACFATCVPGGGPRDSAKLRQSALPVRARSCSTVASNFVEHFAAGPPMKLIG